MTDSERDIERINLNMHEISTGSNGLIYMEISIGKRPQNDATLTVVNPFKTKRPNELDS